MTQPALMLAPLACAVVLLLSGVAKYADREATRSAFDSMRVPRALSSPAVVRALPLAEIALGVLLLVTWGWALALVGVVVTALFAAYWVLVLLVLRRGEEVDCGCFGAAGEDRVSGATLARNSLLVVLSALAVAFGAAGSGLLPALRDLEAGDGIWLLMTVLVAATAVLVVGVRRPTAGEVADEVAEEDLLDYQREPIPFALLRDADGETVTLRELAAQRPQLLFVLSSGCGVCHDVAAMIPGWIPRLGPVEVQTVFNEPLERLPDAVRPAGVTAWQDVRGGASLAFSERRPAAVLLGADKKLAGGPVAGTQAIATFVEEIIAEVEDADEAVITADVEHAGDRAG